MTKMNIDTCNCCDEIWANSNMKHIQLGKHVLNLCPDCYAEYIKSFKQESILDKIKDEIIEMRSKKNCSCSDCIDIIDKYRGEA